MSLLESVFKLSKMGKNVCLFYLLHKADVLFSKNREEDVLNIYEYGSDN
jgi:hypothetical protein